MTKGARRRSTRREDTRQRSPRQKTCGRKGGKPVSRTLPASKDKWKASRSKRKLRIVAALLVALVAAACIWRVGSWQVFDAKYADCEKWRDEVTRACTDCELGGQWADAVLAAMVVESSGNLGVDSVLGVKNDIMQAAEGAWGWIVVDGWPERGLEAQTPQASIWAGVLEFKQNLELWDAYLEGITPEQPEKVQLVVQGYNFGADGWFQWCKDNGIRAYDADVARRYSDEEMPSDAKGTPSHAAKWLEAYERIRAGRAAEAG